VTSWRNSAIGTATAIAIAALVLAQGSSAEPPAKAPPAAAAAAASWYAATVVEDAQGGFLMVHFWSKGQRLRSEAVLAGRRIVTIVDPVNYTIIDAVGHNGISIERSAAARELDGTRGRPFANEVEKLLAQGGELIGTEEAQGKSVDVYRVTDASGRRTIWVSTTNPPVPLRVQTYDRETGTTGKIDYVNWLHNPWLGDEFFTPDPRLKLQHFGYDEYRKRIRRGPVGPAPVLYRHLLHGER
jgi:hypothetical protein